MERGDNLLSEQAEDLTATHPDRRTSGAEPTEGLEERMSGIMPRVHSKLSYVLHTHREAKHIEDLCRQDNGRS